MPLFGGYKRPFFGKQRSAKVVLISGYKNLSLGYRGFFRDTKRKMLTKIQKTSRKLQYKNFFWKKSGILQKEPKKIKKKKKTIFFACVFDDFSHFFDFLISVQCFFIIFSCPPRTPPPAPKPLPQTPSLGPPCRTPLPRTPPPPDRPKFRSFFPSPASFRSFSLSLGVFSLNFGCCLKRRGLIVFGVLALSCETPAAPKPLGFHTTAREPNRAHFSFPAFKNTTKIQREDAQRDTKKSEMVAGEEKSAKFWAVRLREVVWRKVVQRTIPTPPMEGGGQTQNKCEGWGPEGSAPKGRPSFSPGLGFGSVGFGVQV